MDDDEFEEKTPPRKLSAIQPDPLPDLPPAGEPHTSPDLKPPSDPTLEVDVRPCRPLRWWQKPATRADLILAAGFFIAVEMGALALLVAWCR